MMIGERTYINPTVHIPPWTTCPDNPPSDETLNLSPCFNSPPNSISTTPPPCFNNNFNSIDVIDYNFLFQRYLSSNNLIDFGENEEFDIEAGDHFPLDAYSCDNFRIFEFKVKKCQRSRSHDWTECPFAHPGEKARRRDPRKYNYSGNPCPEFRKGSCSKGDGCEYAHGVFECWLHPARYRTQPCKDGLNCKRRICFFAHTTDQLRVLTSPPRVGSFDGLSPKRLLFDGSSFAKSMHLISSPESGSPPTESPPMSPMTKSHSINEVMASLRQLHLNKMKSPTPSALGFQLNGSGCGSPRLSFTRPGLFSLPNTPTTRVVTTQPGSMEFDIWENGGSPKMELSMERVESGKNLRAKLFEKLSKENPLHSVDPSPPEDAPNPDVEWVSELVN